MVAHSPAARIRAHALSLGFEAAGVAALDALEAARHYATWLEAGMHGGMDWLATDEAKERRADPRRILAGVRSVVSVALCHTPSRDVARDACVGRIARYASGDDYHALMKEKLGALARFVEREALPGARALWYSDIGAI